MFITVKKLATKFYLMNLAVGKARSAIQSVIDSNFWNLMVFSWGHNSCIADQCRATAAVTTFINESAISYTLKLLLQETD